MIGGESSLSRRSSPAVVADVGSCWRLANELLGSGVANGHGSKRARVPPNYVVEGRRSRSWRMSILRRLTRPRRFSGRGRRRPEPRGDRPRKAELAVWGLYMSVEGTDVGYEFLETGNLLGFGGIDLPNPSIGQRGVQRGPRCGSP